MYAPGCRWKPAKTVPDRRRTGGYGAARVGERRRGQAIVGNMTRAAAETAPEKTAEARPAITEFPANTNNDDERTGT
jgi:hypothetical protein